MPLNLFSVSLPSSTFSVKTKRTCPKVGAYICPTSGTRVNCKRMHPNFSKLGTSPLKTKYLCSSEPCFSTANSGIIMNTHRVVGDKDGLIIVDHGSRRMESNLMLNEFVNLFRDKTGYSIVEPAHMELAEPSIKDAFSVCVQKGADRVIVCPFFLFPGRHWHQDIPHLTAEAAKEHQNVSYIITAPLGLHELLVDVMNDRIKHCLSRVAGEADECAACIGTGRCKLY
ncbi:unnamed protein product [Cuscuta epithymum]|uniref:Sirohydrochlorin ferrochelatase n=1 Tax=Cuscuta epithymum TaxID=186058 RepID=A0AAV0GG33_9ASTE|nr:unnamed protein product [Cuscuta epithymum]